MSITAIILASIAVFLALYDIYAIFRWGIPGTISYVILTNSQKHPIIAFLVGVIVGHIFW